MNAENTRNLAIRDDLIARHVERLRLAPEEWRTALDQAFNDGWCARAMALVWSRDREKPRQMTHRHRQA